MPVTLPLAEPAAPFKLAVMVTPVAGPMPFTTPVLTVAQGVELCQKAELVTSLLPLPSWKVAVAKRLIVCPSLTVKVLDPPASACVVTVSEVG